MKESHVVILLAAVFIVLSVPLLIDSHMVLAKKHVGPIPFPPDIIPSISHKQITKNHSEIPLK